MTIMGYRKNFFVLLFLSVTVCGVLTEECKDGKCTTRMSTNEILVISTTEEVETHTPSLVDRPKSMNMLAEDVEHTDNSFIPTPLPASELSGTGVKSSKLILEEPKGRALNFSMDEHHIGNNLSNVTARHLGHDDFDLSDVTIGDEDEDMEMLTSKILSPKLESKNASLGIGICEKGGLTYENGEKLTKDCDSICTCRNGKMDCEERCAKPFFRKGKQIEDPLCSAKDVDDPCCAIMICAGDTATEALEICTFGNKTYNRGDIFNKECSEVCTCEAAGKISCKPRCPKKHKTSDRCFEVPDKDDPCCKTVLCDVTLDDNEPEKEDEKTRKKILSAKFVNETTLLLKFDTKLDDNENLPLVEVSNDQNIWKEYKLLPGGYLKLDEPFKYVKLEKSDDIVTASTSKLVEHASSSKLNESGNCQYKGKTFQLGEEYNDQCNSLCVCKLSGMNCLKLQCPTYFGVDVLDPNCVEWETVPPNFNPTPPNCCPDSVRCKNNGSCLYEGMFFKNWEHLPINLTGCEKRCYCENNKVECQNSCPPVTALPPATLPCPPNLAVISKLPEDDCCKYWICPSFDQANEHNNTDSDNWKKNTKNVTKSYTGLITTNAPSKVRGPLLIYQNEDDQNQSQNDSLGTVHKPKISQDENIYFHKDIPPPKPDVKAKSTKEKNVNYINPTKTDKMFNKKTPLFVTPPPSTQSNNHIPLKPSGKNPFANYPQNAINSEIEIHGQGNPEELLQFISQHPEISNYPSGSVLEVHNLDSTVNGKPVSGFPTNSNPQIHLVPYLVPTNSAGEPHQNDLPPGFSLEHILQEFHKNTKPAGNVNLPHSSFVNNNGPAITPQQPGPVIVGHGNNTHKDFGAHGFPTSFPNYQQPQDTITIHTLEAVDAHTVRLAFTVPTIIVGLHGRVEVRYTHDQPDDDLDSWMLQVFAPPNDLIATPSLEFDLQDLKADTEYKFKITITLRDVQNTHSSAIYRIKTPKDIHTTTLPPLIPILPHLEITDINATWVTVGWRKFTEYELQFIDGVQLRYKEIDGKIYAATPLIHRAVTNYMVENLKPNTKYEIGIFFIPFPGQTTELHAANMLHFTTANLVDTYGFNVTVEISQVKSQTVEISWSGVPYPEDKYVNIYRAIYQSDTGKEDQSTFKIAKRDSATKTIITDLKPGTRYRIWLEVYLTNGKIKMSNVQDFITKPRAAPSLGVASKQDKLSRAESLEAKGDYYGPLVIVAILASIAILSTLVLLLILVRRHNQNKAAITPPSSRVSQSAYDNPTYKVEIQQETMGL